MLVSTFERFFQYVSYSVHPGQPPAHGFKFVSFTGDSISNTDDCWGLWILLLVFTFLNIVFCLQQLFFFYPFQLLVSFLVCSTSHTWQSHSLCVSCDPSSLGTNPGFLCFLSDSSFFSQLLSCVAEPLCFLVSLIFCLCSNPTISQLLLACNGAFGPFTVFMTTTKGTVGVVPPADFSSVA